MAKTSWLFVTFGDAGSRKQNGHDRGQGAGWKILVNQRRNEHSLRDKLSHHLVFTKNDEEPGNFGEGWEGKYGHDLLYLVGELSRLANRWLTYLTAMNTCNGGHEVCLQACLMI